MKTVIYLHSSLQTNMTSDGLLFSVIDLFSMVYKTEKIRSVLVYSSTPRLCGCHSG